MSANFRCPRCNELLGTADEPSPTPLRGCPNCGWRATGLKLPSRVPRLLFWLALIVPTGLLAGAVVAHSLLMALFLFFALGPGISAGIGRRTRNNWWVLVLAYSAAFGLGILLFPDGQTVLVGAWAQAASAAGISAVVGLLVGWFSQSDWSL